MINLCPPPVSAYLDWDERFTAFLVRKGKRADEVVGDEAMALCAEFHCTDNRPALGLIRHRER